MISDPGEPEGLAEAGNEKLEIQARLRKFSQDPVRERTENDIMMAKRDIPVPEPLGSDCDIIGQSEFSDQDQAVKANPKQFKTMATAQDLSPTAK